MNKLIIILGLVLLCGTNAQAANLKNKDSTMYYQPTSSFISCNTVKLSPTEDGRSNTVNLKRDISPIVSEDDDPRRGSPDNRGGGGTR